MIVAPARNEGDVDEIPAALRAKLEFHWVQEIGEVLEVALEPRELGYRLSNHIVEPS